ncbi:MAG: MFS transporter, partial [Proteobacteria bacterium]|nr:MFS transporter [Pseudomonadota bacterium]
RVAGRRGLERIVHVSTAAAVGQRRDRTPLCEDDPWVGSNGPRSMYIRSKRESEERALAAARTGLPVTVVNPAVMLGPRANRSEVRGLVQRAAQGVRWVPRGGSSVAAVGDVAQGCVLALERGVVGVGSAVSAARGAVAGGPLDDRFGARRVIIAGLLGLMAASAGVLSVSATQIFYFVDVAPASAGGGLFASPGEQVYLAFSVGLGLVAGPIQASSRSLLARLAPAGMTTEFFGLFAFSGKVTAFAAPLTVGLVTGMTGDQRLGIASIVIFLVLGLGLLLSVKEPNT